MFLPSMISAGVFPVVAWGVLWCCSRNLHRVFCSAPLAFRHCFKSLHKPFSLSIGAGVEQCSQCVFDSITKAELFKFCYELWTIVRSNLIWIPTSGKQKSQSVNYFLSSFCCHGNNFWPFGTSIDDSQPHLSFEGTSKIYVKPFPRLLWHFPWMKWSLGRILLTGQALFKTFLNVAVNQIYHRTQTLSLLKIEIWSNG